MSSNLSPAYFQQIPDVCPLTFSLQESVLLRYLDEIPEWLARYARPAKTSCYPNWTCFLKTFLRQGQLPIVRH